jgi:hypothetical protein
MQMSYLKKLRLLLPPLFLTAIAGCDSGSSSNLTGIPTTPAVGIAPTPIMQDYQIDVVNLTAGQPFSPIALVGHDSSYQAFIVGEAASTELEQLAESGDNSAFLANADESSGVAMSMSAAGPLGPGSTETLTISIAEGDIPGMRLSMVTMLVNTNDSLTAFQGLDIDKLEVGESINMTTISYDSGTEANTELAGTIPGPADGGEGFSATRDDIQDVIHAHSGVVTSDDGLMNSVLNQVHRWDNPVAQVTVTRMQ